MFKVTELPRRPYRNFDHYLEECRKRGKRDALYSCEHCWGRGRVVAPWERPDPVEGYKMADRIDCPTCRGRGEVDRHQAKAWYDKEIAEWREHYTEKQKQRSAELIALKKVREVLSPEERELLGIEPCRRKQARPKSASR